MERKKYSREFKLEAVNLVKDRGVFFEAQILCVDKFPHRLVVNFQPMVFKL
jgi:hypothetical protein